MSTDLIETLLRSVGVDSARRGQCLPDHPGLAYVLFEGRGGVYTTLEIRGYGGIKPAYPFLEDPGVQNRIVREGTFEAGSEHALLAGHRIWVVTDRVPDPCYLLVAEVIVDAPGLGLLLRALLMRSVTAGGGEALDEIETLPVWLSRLVEGSLLQKNPLLIVSEYGSGREELVRAWLRHEFGSPEAGLFFHPGRLSAAVQLREIFGDAAGRRLGGSGPGIPLLKRPEPVIVILEAGDIDPAVQLRLLALFSSGEARNKIWIFLTTMNLQAMVEADLFQEGLYRILRGGEVVLPPLRERRGELSIEIDRQLEELRRGFRRDIRLTSAAREALLSYDWPGNLRELRGTLKSAFLMCRNSQLQKEDFRLGEWRGDAEDDDLNLRRKSEELERSLLLQAYALHGGNQVHMARALGISRGSLQYKMEKYHLQ